MRNLKNLLPLVIAIGVLLGLFTAWIPNFLAVDNMIGLAERISVNAILAFGMTLTILIGGIDLSVGAVLALVGTSTVYILSAGSDPAGGETLQQSIPWMLLAILAGLGVSAAFGAINGVCAAKTRMPPFIITLATMMVARGFARSFNQGQPLPVAKHETAFRALGIGKDPLFGAIPVPVLAMIAVFVLAALLLHRTRFGQHVYAIGGNREAARYTGVPLVRTEIGVYLLCSLFAGIAGIIHTASLFSASPVAGEGYELNAIAAAVVGGTSFTGGIGSMYGTLLGAIIIGIIDKGLVQGHVDPSLQLIVKGLVILVAVFVDVQRRK